ncbi:MAG TPA: hypothetical protein VMP11_14600 [Verrucomicrobiae bacterium]|nr:hypothetical protein [Verrucomicrobiae bacterium]
MKGQRPPQGSLFACVRLEEMIPSDQLLRRIQRAIDFTFIDRLTEPLYSGIGRPSVPPQVLVEGVSGGRGQALTIDTLGAWWKGSGTDY